MSLWTSMDSPVGELRIIAADDAVTAVEYAVEPAETASPYSSVSRAAATSARRVAGLREDSTPVLVEAVRQLRAYFDRDLKEFDLPLRPSGTPFQLRVWDELLRIGYGETASYAEIAARLGKSRSASRAVGLANGRNPIPIVIPCHRVIGANGALTGYAGGLERKRTLLLLEQEALFGLGPG
jgi:methylated-DNA-[protein]-cysteine S-methyltransferase